MFKFKNIPNFSPLPRVGEVGRRSCEGARQTLRSRDSRAGIRQKSPAAILTLLSRLPLTRSPSDLSHKGRGEILKFFGINILLFTSLISGAVSNDTPSSMLSMTPGQLQSRHTLYNPEFDSITTLIDQSSLPQGIKLQIPILFEGFSKFLDRFITSINSDRAQPIEKILYSHEAIVIATYLGDVIEQKASPCKRPTYSIHSKNALIIENDIGVINLCLAWIGENQSKLRELYKQSSFINDLISLSIENAQNLISAHPEILVSQNLYTDNIDSMIIRLSSFFPHLKSTRVNPSRLLALPAASTDYGQKLASLLGIEITADDINEMGLVPWPHGIHDLVSLIQHGIDRDAYNTSFPLLLKKFAEIFPFKDRDIFLAVIERQISMFTATTTNLRYVMSGQTHQPDLIYDTLEQLNMNLTKLWYDFEIVLGQKHYSDPVFFIGWLNRITKKPEPYFIVGNTPKSPEWTAFVDSHSNRLITFLKVVPLIQDVINFTTSGAVICLKKIKNHFETEKKAAGKIRNNKKKSTSEKLQAVRQKDAAQGKIDNITAIINNMNDLIQKFTPYFPQLKEVKVGTKESETLVFENLRKIQDQLQPNQTDEPKKKRKKKKKAESQASSASITSTTESLTVVQGPTPVIEEIIPAIVEQAAAPVIDEIKPVEQPKVLERATSLRTLLSVDERRLMIEERRRSRQLQRTESGRFEEVKSARPLLERSTSVMLTRANELRFTNKKVERNFNAVLESHPDLIAEIRENPWSTSGLGQPELLSGNLKGWYSRKLDDKNRLVYQPERLNDGKVIVHIQRTKGHY